MVLKKDVLAALLYYDAKFLAIADSPISRS